MNLRRYEVPSHLRVYRPTPLARALLVDRRLWLPGDSLVPQKLRWPTCRRCRKPYSREFLRRNRVRAPRPREVPRWLRGVPSLLMGDGVLVRSDGKVVVTSDGRVAVTEGDVADCCACAECWVPLVRCSDLSETRFFIPCALCEEAPGTSYVVGGECVVCGGLPGVGTIPAGSIGITDPVFAGEGCICDLPPCTCACSCFGVGDSATVCRTLNKGSTSGCMVATECTQFPDGRCETVPWVPGAGSFMKDVIFGDYPDGEYFIEHWSFGTGGGPSYCEGDAGCGQGFTNDESGHVEGENFTQTQRGNCKTMSNAPGSTHSGPSSGKCCLDSSTGISWSVSISHGGHRCYGQVVVEGDTINACKDGIPDDQGWCFGDSCDPYPSEFARGASRPIATDNARRASPCVNCGTPNLMKGLEGEELT